MELALETAQRVRRTATGLLLMDVHSLTLGMDEKRRRFLARAPAVGKNGWDAWMSYK